MKNHEHFLKQHSIQTMMKNHSKNSVINEYDFLKKLKNMQNARKRLCIFVTVHKNGNNFNENHQAMPYNLFRSSIYFHSINMALKDEYIVLQIYFF